MSKYTVGDCSFGTLDEIRRKVRSIRDKYKDGIFIDDGDLKFMRDLLNRHERSHQKIGCGIAAMYVKKNTVFKNNRGFYLVRMDGTETDFSYEMCLRNKSESRLQKFKSACREAVTDTIINFKRGCFADSKIKTCPITGESITPDNSHVDHEPPMTFDEIVRRFIDDNQIDIERVELSGIGEDGSIRNRIKNEILRDMFIAYHNQRALLRIVSPQANLSIIKLFRKDSGGRHGRTNYGTSRQC